MTPRYSDSELASWTLLHHAANEGRKEVVAFLLNHGAAVNSITSTGDTALHYAAAQNFCPSVRILLAHGALISIPNQAGKTPLDVAVADAAEILRSSMKETRP